MIAPDTASTPPQKLSGSSSTSTGADARPDVSATPSTAMRLLWLLPLLPLLSRLSPLSRLLLLLLLLLVLLLVLLRQRAGSSCSYRSTLIHLSATATRRATPGRARPIRRTPAGCRK